MDLLTLLVNGVLVAHLNLNQRPRDFGIYLNMTLFMSPWRSGEGRRTDFDKFVSQHLSGAGSSPAGSVSRDLNLRKLNYQYLTTSVAVVLVVR